MPGGLYLVDMVGTGVVDMNLGVDDPFRPPITDGRYYEVTLLAPGSASGFGAPALVWFKDDAGIRSPFTKIADDPREALAVATRQALGSRLSRTLVTLAGEPFGDALREFITPAFGVHSRTATRAVIWCGGHIVWSQLGPPRAATKRKKELWPTDGTTLSSGQNEPWSEDEGGFSVVSGWVELDTPVTGYVRCTASLDTDDHYHQATAEISARDSAQRRVGLNCRHVGSSTRTYYSMLLIRSTTGDQHRLYKNVSASATNLATDGTDPGGTAGLLKVHTNGSAILGSFGPSAIKLGPITDTSITGNIQVGFLETHTGGSPDFTETRLDNHAFADLEPGGLPEMSVVGQAIHRAAYF